MSIQAAAGVGQFDLVYSIGFGQRAAMLTGWQVIGCRGQRVALMLLDMSKVNESLTGIKWDTG
ncbi:hypothetical protein D3C78_1890290 [compost metagenome]